MVQDDESVIDFKVFWGFALRLTDGRTDICDCRVAFATENKVKVFSLNIVVLTVD